MFFFPKRKAPKGGRNTGLRGGRAGRTVVALAVMVGLGLVLAALGVVTSRRDLALAIGPSSAAQRQWLDEAADRPDIAQFFKKLSHEQRIEMARAIGRYDDAPLAKLTGLLLADFDEEARAILQRGLGRIAAVHPEDVAAQLVQTGGFQQLAVFAALRTLGDRAITPVAAMLDNGDARPAAIAYLVAAGPAAIPALLPRLNDPKPEVRLAAADALGGLRAREAIAPLLKDLAEAPVADRPAYLADLAAIGDPSTEPLLASVLDDTARPLAERTAVALGLGRIGGPVATPLLWRYAATDEPVLAHAAFAALVTVGAPALQVPEVPPAIRIRLAAALVGPEADGVLRIALTQPETRLAAVQGAKERPSLIPDLAALLPLAKEDGELAAALVADLSATDAGRALLAPYRDDPGLTGFIQRAHG